MDAEVPTIDRHVPLSDAPRPPATPWSWRLAIAAGLAVIVAVAYALDHVLEPRLRAVCGIVARGRDEIVRAEQPAAQACLWQPEQSSLHPRRRSTCP